MSYTLHNCDCLEYMKMQPDKSFDLAVVDPPYGIGAAKEKPHNGWKDWGLKDWDESSPEVEYFNELCRCSENQIIWGANHFIGKIKRRGSCWLIWDKGQRSFSLADGEMAITSFNTAVRIFTYSRAAALQEGKIHPTQKPIALYNWIFANYAIKGQRVLDTHLGSGSSAISAMNYGLDFVGCEIDPEYFAVAKRRIEQASLQGQLFTPTIGNKHEAEQLQFYDTI